MNVSLWLRKAKRVVSPLDADLMVMTALGKADRADVILVYEKELTIEEMGILEKMLILRQRHVPMAYLMGYKEFYGREFRVTPEVLIPRPETEVIIDIVRGLPGKRVLDVGTGSGCIAVSLALETGKEVAAVDVSREALRVAADNAERLGAKVDFYESDLLDNYVLADGEIVVANLPYVDPAWEWTSPEIAHEPKIALFADDGGLELIFKLIDKLAKVCYNSNYSSYLVLESDRSQHQRIIEYAKKTGFCYEKTEGLITVFSFSSRK